MSDYDPRRWAQAIDNDGTPSQVGSSSEALRDRAAHIDELPKLAATFAPGTRVEKFKGDYGGPGTVVTSWIDEGGERIVVAHKIEGGFGTLKHIYAPGQLRLAGPHAADPKPLIVKGSK